MKKSKFLTNCSRCGRYYETDSLHLMAFNGKIAIRLCDDCCNKFKAFMDEYDDENEGYWNA